MHIYIYICPPTRLRVHPRPMASLLAVLAPACPAAPPPKSGDPQLRFIHAHQLFRIPYTCFELDTVKIDWWICTNVCLVGDIGHRSRDGSVPPPPTQQLCYAILLLYCTILYYTIILYYITLYYIAARRRISAAWPSVTTRQPDRR